jgi:cell division protease FtsH
MVGRWGKSEANGPMSVLPAPGQEQLMLPGASEGLSEAARQLIESEARRIVEECYARALEGLSANRGRLDRLAAALLEHETLDEPEVYRLAGIDRDATPMPEPPTAAVPFAGAGSSIVAKAVGNVEA